MLVLLFVCLFNFFYALCYSVFSKQLRLYVSKTKFLRDNKNKNLINCRREVSKNSHLPSLSGGPHSSVGAVGAGAAAVRRVAGDPGCRPDAPGARASPGRPSPQSSAGLVT